MKYSAPAAESGQELNLDHQKSQFSKKSKGINRLKILDELARKWVRYGCAETPKEALRMLLGES